MGKFSMESNTLHGYRKLGAEICGWKIIQKRGEFCQKCYLRINFFLGTLSLVCNKKIMMHKGNAKRIIMLKNRSELNFFPVDKLT